MQARWVLEALEVIVSLTGTSMKWKPKKSIFLCIKEGPGQQTRQDTNSRRADPINSRKSD